MIFMRILEALERLERGQAELRAKLETLRPDGAANDAGRRLQEGIDNIMGYQWPPTKEEGH